MLPTIARKAPVARSARRLPGPQAVCGHSEKNGVDGDVCTIEVFRPDYYKLSNEENIKKAAAVTRAHVEAYC